MADLMTDRCTFDELVNKYNNFHVPAIHLYVGGRNVVQDLELDIQSLEITLALQTVSMAVIRLSGIYDMKTRSFDSRVKDKFKLGTVVEVGIGYVSEIQKVLKGFVASLRVEFGESSCFVVTVMDVRQLMITGGVHQVLHDVTNYSDAVQTILEEYSVLCTAEIEATEDQLEAPLSQRSTDYDFITRELIALGRCDREFLVVGDKAYFRKPYQNTTPICSMELGKELKEFRIESTYTNLQVDVIGYDPKEQAIVTASAKAKSTEAQNSLFTTPLLHNIVDPDVDTQDKANVRAQVYAERRVSLGQTGSGICVGLPELIPGRFVEIVMLEEMVNKKYYIKQVKHNIDKKGFVTSFETEGWKE